VLSQNIYIHIYIYILPYAVKFVKSPAFFALLLRVFFPAGWPRGLGADIKYMLIYFPAYFPGVFGRPNGYVQPNFPGKNGTEGGYINIYNTYVCIFTPVLNICSYIYIYIIHMHNKNDMMQAMFFFANYNYVLKLSQNVLKMYYDSFC